MKVVGILVGILGVDAVSFYAKKELNKMIIEQELGKEQQEPDQQQGHQNSLSMDGDEYDVEISSTENISDTKSSSR